MLKINFLFFSLLVINPYKIVNHNRSCLLLLAAKNVLEASLTNSVDVGDLARVVTTTVSICIWMCECTFFYMDV